MSLSVERMNIACYGAAAVTYSRISSAIRCELSIRPRSANKESAAEDLYALRNVKTWGSRVTKRELHTLCHFLLQSIGLLVRVHAEYSPGMLRVRPRGKKGALMETFVRWYSRA